MIVQSLRLCSGSDRNAHKETFASILLKYLYSDEIIEKFTNFDLTLVKNSNIIVQHCSTQYPKIDRTLLSPNDFMDDFSSAKISPEKQKKSKKNLKKSISDHSLSDFDDEKHDNSDTNGKNYNNFKKMNLEDTAKYLAILSNCSNIMHIISERIEELEQTVSILQNRLFLLEKEYQ
ncbi:hypothetical protein TVAG_014150 [Trichomonas vaginalis G3]|uniref:Uncharacterized protein n=1 Tax=Trichomonas vaginalis (strain ATCC PRA-98 / G3) TaxID=412133 RepID=A2DDG9_TRIV3|nr:hypothetical protein TVAGG3_0986120 [Trichomonas vaginalis G3]EAY21648.1 hypothetical protein TVAG_014150 [Trichomonas vaginalis G3]KAI5489676.1 hypothetical protein TVAGG3_0986120 [Trichomonas vaginalis G3]|eukprot:XP_001582634.1 hypothetical protein [Trichomonas vaginalis G3]